MYNVGLKGGGGGSNSFKMESGKLAKAEELQKVGRPMPRTGAWLRPWRSAWMKAAAAGGV